MLACPATLNGAAATEVLLPPPEWNNGIRPPKEGTGSTLYYTLLYFTLYDRSPPYRAGAYSGAAQQQSTVRTYLPSLGTPPHGWQLRKPAVLVLVSASQPASQPASQSISQSVNAASWVISASPYLPCLSPSCVKQGPDRRLQLVSRTEILYIHILKSTGRHTSPPPPSPASQENTLHSCGGALRCIAVR